MNNKSSKSKIIGGGIVVFIALILLDQFTKLAAQKTLMNQNPIVLIKNVFQLQYLENRGAAFGILQGQKGFFVIITIAILAAICYVYFKMPLDRKFFLIRILLVLIAAGALGNFIDRVFRGYVIDFFYFSIINFPIFNVADIYVTGSVIILAVAILFHFKDDDIRALAESLVEKKR